jgi:hypothetical protein
MSKKNKTTYLRNCGDGIHRWAGATYQVEGSRYRQVYAPGYPASNWRKLK